MDGETVQFQAEIHKASAQKKKHNHSINQYIVCFPNLRKSLVFVNSGVQGSDNDDDDDEDDADGR